MSIPNPQVVLTGAEAVIFLAHREKFALLLAAGVFDLDEGKAEINMHNGQVQGVHIHRMTYKRAAESV